MDRKPYSSKQRLTFLQALAFCGVVIILLEVFKNTDLEKRIRKFEQKEGF